MKEEKKKGREGERERWVGESEVRMEGNREGAKESMDGRMDR